MKFSYEFIKENQRIYELAKQQLPIITNFERGDVSHTVMRNIGLEKFVDFFNFMTELNKHGFTPIQAISYKELKQILIDKTQNVRFKTWLKNKTNKSFKKLIEEDSQTFDRLLNGRWISKPGYNMRGRKIWGRRANNVTEGFDVAFIPLLNWIISNDIDTCDKLDNDIYKNFKLQDKYANRIKWYTDVQLSIENVPQREIEITQKLTSSLIDFIDSSNMDFRKLNYDFIIDTMQNKIRRLMEVPRGTVVRSKVDVKSSYNQNRLTERKEYTVEASTINSGFIRVLVVDDSGNRNWYDYRQFEDKSIERDLILSQLGII